MIAAQGEHKASLALKEASDVMAESSAAMQLRYLQVGLAGVLCVLFYPHFSFIKRL